MLRTLDIEDLNESQSIYTMAVHIKLLKSSFVDFFRFYWHCVAPDEIVENWHIEYLANILQEYGEDLIAGRESRGPLLINISPGETKSTLVSIMFPLWLWINKPTLKILNVSHSSTISQGHLEATRKIIKSASFQQYFGDIVSIRSDRDSMSRYVNTKGGVRRAARVGSKVTGKHYDCFLLDDLLNAEEDITTRDLKKATGYLKTLATRKGGANRLVALQIMVAQRVHDQDPCGYWINTKKDNLQHIKLPATSDYDILPKKLIKYYKDGLMNPLRTSFRLLKDMEDELGPSGYANQFGQATQATRRKHS